MRSAHAIGGLALGAALLAACPRAAPVDETSWVLVGAGDISSCDDDHDEQTAHLVDDVLARHRRAAVFTLGDNVYETGSAEEFARCFAPTWGRFRDRTYPALGNHEYVGGDAAPYFGYFAERAGTAGLGWYSYDWGSWHVVVLNSNCKRIGGCGRGSAQLQWLEQDLARHPARCTLAYWHHPRFSSGPDGSTESMGEAWSVLQAAGADLALAGHIHNYERLAPLDDGGQVAPATGIPSFVVGAGGKSHGRFAEARRAGSLLADAEHFGVLELTLDEGSWRARFLGAPDGRVLDTASGTCR